MDRYAVVGNPVEHSRSPFIHALFAQMTGEELRYERLLSPLDAFATTVKRFAGDGGRGCNVTVPFKHEAFALAPRASERARRARAANTLRFDVDGWFADNTDGIGLVRDIVRHAGFAIEGRRVLLIGAGGAAAGVLGALIEQAPHRLALVNRTAARAQALAESHLAFAEAHGVSLAALPIEACGEDYDIVVNATASSLQGAAVPVASGVLASGALAIDMMYGAAARDFMDWARVHGAIARDGLGMLVEQAAESFALWRGVRPETGPVLQALRERLASEPPT